MNRVGLVLAAGLSRRFGDSNKLIAPFRGAPLASWTADALRHVPVAHRLVVTASPEVADLFSGYEVLQGAGPESGQADSLRIGVARAAEFGADRMLVVLADMPLVRHGVMAEVFDACDPGHASAATDGTRRMPPACFPASMFGRLAALTGDRGAGALLAELPEDRLVTVPGWMLADVDLPEDLEALG